MRCKGLGGETFGFPISKQRKEAKLLQSRQDALGCKCLHFVPEKYCVFKLYVVMAATLACKLQIELGPT